MKTDKDWICSGRGSVFKTLGASNHTDKEREHRDYYATEPCAAEMLIDLEHLTPNVPIWEPAAGEGHLADVFTARGFNVRKTDIVSRRPDIEELDFFVLHIPYFSGHIITNPHYRQAAEFVKWAIFRCYEGKVCMFLKLTFLEGVGRFHQLFSDFPPTRIWVSSKRILCAKNGDFEGMRLGGGSAVAYGWYVWDMTNYAAYGPHQKYTT